MASRYGTLVYLTISTVPNFCANPSPSLCYIFYSMADRREHIMFATVDIRF